MSVVSPIVPSDIPPCGAQHRMRRRSASTGGLAAWQLRRAEQLVLAEAHRGLTVARMAAACRLSRGHFSKAFKESTGQPPHRWLMARRIERAQALLAGTTLTLAQVATECGFADQSHLTRAFTAAVGAPPGCWRKDLPARARCA